MNKKFFLGLFIGIGVSVIALILFFYTKINRNREITFGELTAIITGLFIAIYIPIAVGQTLENKKNLKTYVLEEIEQIESYYQSIETILEDFYSKPQDINIFKTLVRSKIKHIANKISDLKNNSFCLNKIDLLIKKNNTFREDITESFGNSGFIINEVYIQLFVKCFDDVKTIISEIKKEILSK